MFPYPESDRIRTEVAGLNLRNPTMLASGILGTSASILKKVADAGAGAIVTKSIGMKSREGYLNPTVIQAESGLLNAVGLANPGIHKFKREIEELSKLQIPLIVSVYGFSPAEYMEAAKIASESGADAVELNLSCPHVKGAGTEAGQDAEMIVRIVKKVKKAVGKPVFAKLTPNVANVAGLAKAAVSSGIDAVTAVNTLRAMKIDIETRKPVLANKIGGLSGGAIRPVAVRCVYEIHEAVNVPIIGCGGIRTWRDAVEFILAGASAIQIGSAVAYESIDVFRKISSGIESYLERNGYGGVKEIVGLAHEN